MFKPKIQGLLILSTIETNIILMINGSKIVIYNYNAIESFKFTNIKLFVSTIIYFRKAVHRIMKLEKRATRAKQLN